MSRIQASLLETSTTRTWGQHGARVLELVVVDAHGDGLEARDGGGHGDEGVLSRFGTQTPHVGTLGPEHPRTGMRLELARHAEAVGPGRARRVSPLRLQILRAAARPRTSRPGAGWTV